MRNDPSGFSLIELLIVVLVIGIVAAIAIPNMLASRRSANEASAISHLRLLHGAQMSYASSNGLGNYAGDPTSAVNTAMLVQLGAAGIIDNSFASGTKSGFLFTGAKADATLLLPSSFCARAVPIVAGGVFSTGPRNVAISTAGVLYTGDAEIPTSAACSLVGGFETITGGTPLGE